MGRIIVLLVLCFCMTGCGTVAYLVNPPPEAKDLYVTEDDVMAVIDALDEKESPDPDAVVHNPHTDRYELTPEAMERAVSDSVMKQVYEKNIEEAVKKMDGWNLGAVFRRDIFNIFTGALGVLLVILLL